MHAVIFVCWMFAPAAIALIHSWPKMLIGLFPVAGGVCCNLAIALFGAAFFLMGFRCTLAGRRALRQDLFDSRARRECYSPTP